jgi:gas vesicle protein
METGKILLGMVAGVATGVLLGILFAPEKGSKTRTNILAKGEDYVDVLKGKFDELVDGLGKRFESTGHAAGSLAEKGKEKFDQVRKEVKRATA